MEEKLKEFLIEAKKITYANEDIKKMVSPQMGSFNYEYSKDGMVYHNKYFGTLKIIGEEVVYIDGNVPYWGMNYFGDIIDSALSEEAIDKVFRPALMLVGSDFGSLPVRGPKEFINGEFRYTFDFIGNINKFTGFERIYKNDNIIYELRCHGGVIE